MAKAGAQIEISASSSRLAAGLNVAKDKFMQFGRGVTAGLGAAFKGINAKLKPGDTMKNAMGHLGGDIMGRGMDAILDTAGAVRAFESDMQRLGQTSHQTPAQMEELRRSMMEVSAATGVSREELLKASGVYYDLTSDAAGMSASIATLAKVSQASGAGMEELVRTAASLKDSMGIDSTQFEGVFSGLIAQGEAGKVTLKELGAEAPALLAAFAKWGQGVGGVMQMNAAFQVGAKAFGSASQAGTGLEAMLGMLAARQKQLGKAGIQVFDKKGKLNDMPAVLDQIRKKLPDQRKWSAVFGENKEGRAFLEMLLKYPDAFKEIDKAGQNTGLVQEYAFARSESTAGRLDIAFNNMKNTIAEAFTPERIEAFVRGVENLAEKLGPVVDKIGWLADKAESIQNFGKSVRGFLAGDQNPYAQEVGSGWMGAAIGMTDPKKAARSKASYDGWQTASKGILSKEKGERTTKESIVAAYLASSTSLDHRDPNVSNKLGAVTAGSTYLSNAGVTKEQAADEYASMLLKVQKDGYDAIAKAIASSRVQIGDNQVARATSKATDARRSSQ